MPPSPPRAPRMRLADDLADRVLALIRAGTYRPGDRLPAIAHMAQEFGVSPLALREALRKLEVIGAVEIMHGAGVFVQRGHDMLLVLNPTSGRRPSKALILDLIEARVPVETRAIALAAEHASADHLRRLEDLLTEAEASVHDPGALSEVNMEFHREIAVASGNAVLAQLQEILGRLFHDEQRHLIDIYGSRERDHCEHVGLFEAVRQRDAGLAEQRMRAHLGGVRDIVLRWDPTQTPLA